MQEVTIPSQKLKAVVVVEVIAVVTAALVAGHFQFVVLALIFALEH